MRGRLHTFHDRQDGITIPTIRVAFALSLILHALALWSWPPQIMRLPFDDVREGKPSGSLAVRLAPAPSAAAPAPPPAPALQAAAAPARAAVPARAAPRTPRPRVLALERPSPSAAAPPSPARAAPPQEDLASYVEAHRRAREPEPAPPQPQPPAESEEERHNRAVAASLGLNRTPSFGTNRNRGGGVFQIARIGYNDAEFFFFGWNKDIKRNSEQMIEVSRGDNPTTEIAVVRRMIAIIREQVSGDFTWESQRLGRDVTLSARADDNAGLEDFMMQEFFPTKPRR
ncbi:MAG TPA: hypothetical protein VIF38_13210 [Burkholderiales bacterium]|jgi:hypothetical protein